MSLTCPQHRSKAPGASHGDAQRRMRGGTAAHQGGPGWHDGAEDAGHADHDMLNGDAVRPRNLDRSGVQCLHTIVITGCLSCGGLVGLMCFVEFLTGGCGSTAAIVSLTNQHHFSAVSLCSRCAVPDTACFACCGLVCALPHAVLSMCSELALHLPKLLTPIASNLEKSALITCPCASHDLYV